MFKGKPFVVFQVRSQLDVCLLSAYLALPTSKYKGASNSIPSPLCSNFRKTNSTKGRGFMQLVDPEHEHAQEQYTEPQGPACARKICTVLPATAFASKEKIRRSTSRSQKGL